MYTQSFKALLIWTTDASGHTGWRILATLVPKRGLCIFYYIGVHNNEPWSPQNQRCSHGNLSEHQLFVPTISLHSFFFQMYYLYSDLFVQPYLIVHFCFYSGSFQNALSFPFFSNIVEGIGEWKTHHLPSHSTHIPINSPFR